jgi:hypothetical protein
MLMADQFDAEVFGAHFGSGDARVPGFTCRVFRFLAYCMSCGGLGVACRCKGFRSVFLK